ncbi:MAG: Ldh family oxidoreductase [Myxococcales bacterium]|nr:Ldh family oxidoreductase [Myxococcales bacterium]
MSDEGAMIEVAAEPLCAGLVAALVRRLGLARADAVTTVEHWLRSEQAGKPCHGLVRALYVAQSGEFGPYAGAPAPAPVRVAAGRLHVDGRGHLGYPLVRGLIEAGCAEAQAHGTCVAIGAGVYPSGMLGDWARMACARGCGVVLASGSPARVAAPDGRTPLIGTNPLCVGLPAGARPFVCDASTSALTHGDLLLARGTGAALPADAAVDGEGARTTSASAVDVEHGRGALLPIGGSHKAFAIGMAIELLTSLGGGVPGSPRHAEHGVFALLLGPALVAESGPAWLAGLAGFAERGARIPGWASQARAEAQARAGTVRLAASTHDRLLALTEAA